MRLITIAEVYFWRYPRWINDSRFIEVCFAPDHRQSRTENINRCLTLISMAPCFRVPSPTVTFRWRHYSSFLFPLNVDLYTGQQQQFLHPPSTSQPHNLSPLARLPIPTFHPTTTVLSHLVWVISVEARWLTSTL